MKKSYIIGFLLTLILGPLGLIYSNVAAAIIIFILGAGLSSLAGIFGLLLLWPISIVVGLFTVSSYNSRVNLEDKKHNELVEAIKQGNF